MTTQTRQNHPLGPEIFRGAVVDSFVKLDPRIQFKNPVMFIVEIGSVMTTVVFAQASFSSEPAIPCSPVRSASGSGSRCCFANFAEAMAEGRGKAQAATLRRSQAETMARRLTRQTTRRRCRRSSLRERRPRPRRGRAGHPRRRGGHRGGRQRGRVGDHGRVGAGDPRVGRRPVGRHGRDAGPLRQDQVPRSRRTRARPSSTG